MQSSDGLGPVIGAVVFGLALTGQSLPAATVSGEAVEVDSNVVHANGNVYDQVLLRGRSATVAADLGQITRVSFVDLNDDIVQVEFSGAGTMTVSLEAMSGPAAPVNYNQPGVLYMRGAASISITGSNASTYLNIFAVGPATAVNQSIIRRDANYDGVVDMVLVQINADPANPNGSEFGSIFAGNVHFSGFRGRIGIYADHVHVQNLVRIHDITAFDDAVPYLQFGVNSRFRSVQVTGGDLYQPNGQPIRIKGFEEIIGIAGVSIPGKPWPIGPNLARYERDGLDVTDQIVVPPKG